MKYLYFLGGIIWFVVNFDAMELPTNKLLPRHYEMVDSVPIATGRNIHYIYHVSAAGLMPTALYLYSRILAIIWHPVLISVVITHYFA